MNNLQLALTKLYLKLRGAKFVGVTHIKSSLGTAYEAIIFSEKELFTIGQSVLFVGTVIINQLALNKSKLLDYVLVHEFAHVKQWYGNILALIFGLFMLFALGSLTALVITLLNLVIRFNAYAVLMFIMSLLITSGLIFMGAMCSWFIEYKADSKAISVLGQKRLFEALVERKELCPKPSKTLMVIAFLTHLPINLTLKIYKLLHGSIPS
jgi:hypothetical protein